MKTTEDGYKPMNTQYTNTSLKKPHQVKVVRISNFLSNEDNNALHKAVCKEKKSFKNYEFPGSDKQTTTFLELSSGSKNNSKTTLTQKAYDTINKQIIKQLPFIFNKLNIPPFPISEIPLTFVNCSDGHYGTPHADSINGQYQISILYYFNCIPKVFNGGDLQIFNTDNNSSKGYNSEPLFTINFENNLLLAFPSETFHGVTKVQSNSKKFSEGRFIAVGFIGSQS
ncbi:2OG-Fe(II) oxygenase [Tenacibaculum halocynthiae]|uniref:2OG-Fe(II) oxygenase n=1 Tax=Tenacibaculum halocynthiae TaxID=1254437 RepID=UPI003D64E3BF